MFCDVDRQWDKRVFQSVDNLPKFGLIFSKTCVSVDIPLKNAVFLWITLWTVWTEQVFEPSCTPGDLYTWGWWKLTNLRNFL